MKDYCSTIKELEQVVLKRDLPDVRLAVGDIGTVVMVHKGVPGSRWSS